MEILDAESFLCALSAALAGEGALEAVCSTDPVEDGETVLGTLPNRLRSLDVLRRWLRDEFRQTLRCHLPNEASLDDLSAERKRQLIAVLTPLISLAQQSELVNDLFWKLVRDHFRQAVNEGIGIRVDWQIVTLPSDDGDRQRAEHQKDCINCQFNQLLANLGLASSSPVAVMELVATPTSAGFMDRLGKMFGR